MGKHCSAEQWAAWVGEQRESELSVADFCDWIGVSPNSFCRWREKLSAKSESPVRQQHETRRRSTMKRSMAAGPEFVPLTVLTSTAVEIDLPCGAVVRVPNDDRSLRRVISILTTRHIEQTRCRQTHRFRQNVPRRFGLQSGGPTVARSCDGGRASFSDKRLRTAYKTGTGSRSERKLL